MKNQFKSGTRERRGSAMIAGIFVVLAVSVLSMSYLQLSLNRSRENATSIDSKRAFYMAEAGLAEGYAALVAGKSGVVGSADEPAVYANGVFWVEATPISSTRTQLKSTGLSGTGRDSLTIVIDKVTRTLADYGIFGDEGLNVGPGVTIDSYDSRVEDADAAPIAPILDDLVGGVIFGDGDSRLRLGSNQDVTIAGSLLSPTVVDGDVTPGPGGSVVMGLGAAVSGSTAPADASVNLRTMTPPEVRDAGSLVQIRAQDTVHDPALSLYSTIDVQAGKLTFVGPSKIVTDRLLLGDGAEIEFDTTKGPVRFYVDTQLHLASGSTLSSVTEDPTKVMMVINAVDRVREDGSTINAVTLKSGGKFYGFMYSPEAELNLNSSLDFYGGMVAKKITLDRNASIHFDEALLDIMADGSHTARDLLSWRMVELPNEEIVKTAVDPIKWMKLRGKTLAKPSESHDDDWDGVVDNADRLLNRLKEVIIN